MRANSLAATYALQSEFTRDMGTMAILPGSVLANLHRIMGDIRQAMALMAALSQVLVAASVLAGLFILSYLLNRQVAPLRALGAPARFVLAVVWLFAAVLVVAGTVLGCGIVYGAAAILSRMVAARTDVAVSAVPGWGEIHALAAFLSVATLLCLLPAFAVLRRPVMQVVRS